MNVVTGVFDSVGDAENAIKALLNAGAHDDDLGVVVHDNQKGTVLADDLGREYASEATPPTSDITSRTSVWDRLPDRYVDFIHHTQLPDDAANWYQQHVDAGDILLIVNAGDHLDDDAQIIKQNDGMLFGTQPAQPATGTPVSETTKPTFMERLTRKPEERRVEEQAATEPLAEEAIIPSVILHEELRVERHKLDHPVSPDEYKGLKTDKDVLRIPIVEQEVLVTRRPIVREELVVMRSPTTSEQPSTPETFTRTEEKTNINPAPNQEEQNRAA